MTSIEPAAIVWPAIAQVALTAAVWVALYVARLREMRARRIVPQAVATSRLAAGALENVAAADNFRNLFEIPVLFFALVPLLLVTHQVSGVELALAWLFVALRVCHSVIHVGYNRVTHRFAAYVASTACLFVMWVLFALALAGLT